MQVQKSIAEVLENHLREYTHRDRSIILGRLVSRPKETLDAIGEHFDLTRERIRQLESVLRAEMRGWLDINDEVRSFCDRIVDATGSVTPFHRVQDAVPDLTTLVSIETVPGLFEYLEAWKVVWPLDGSFESDGSWFYASSKEEVCITFDQRFSHAAGDKNFLSAPELLVWFQNWGSATPDELAAWAMSRGYTRVLGSLVSPKVRAMHDLAEIALQIHGAPMTLEELHAIASPKKSLRSLSNQLATSPRLQRVGADSWGLVAWGGEKFSSIREAILARVDLLGSVSIEDLVEEMVAKFGVAESSVRAYAASWPLKSAKGFVTRQTELVTPQGRPLSRSRGCFVTAEGLSFKTDVTSEHIRGSGSQFPTALAVALGNQIGNSLIFKSKQTSNSIKLSWNGNQATISTIRSELEAINASVGDQVSIVFQSGIADFRKLEGPKPDPLAELGRLCLIPEEVRVTRISVASAIGLDVTAVWDEILQSVIARKDEQLVGAVRRVIETLMRTV